MPFLFLWRSVDAKDKEGESFRLTNWGKPFAPNTLLQTQLPNNCAHNPHPMGERDLHRNGGDGGAGPGHATSSPSERGGGGRKRTQTDKLHSDSPLLALAPFIFSGPSPESSPRRMRAAITCNLSCNLQKEKAGGDSYVFNLMVLNFRVLQ